MLTEAEFIEQQRVLGRRIHEHDGVCWETTYPFYCKPVFEFKAIAPGTARPARRHSWLGYSHPVPSPEQGNRSLPTMVLERARLEGFDLQKLPAKRRNIVRRALKQCEIRPILDIERHLERIREINVSQARRHQEGAGAQTPVRRYTEHADSWRDQIRREFALRGREWWGAFVGEVLAAYLRTYQVDGIRVIQHAKTDTEYFRHYPMDALYFRVLSEAAATPSCLRIVNGRPMQPSLNHFKEQFLFQAVEMPYFSAHARLVEFAKRGMAFSAHVRSALCAKRASRRQVDAAGQEPS